MIYIVALNRIGYYKYMINLWCIFMPKEWTVEKGLLHITMYTGYSLS